MYSLWSRLHGNNAENTDMQYNLVILSLWGKSEGRGKFSIYPSFDKIKKKQNKAKIDTTFYGKKCIQIVLYVWKFLNIDKK